ncbi:MAG: ATP-binding protein [Bacteroidales bacterium]
MSTGRDKYIVKKLEAKVKNAIYSYGLIHNDDGVLVGISGGKDSYALLDLLVNLNRSMPDKFRIEACHVQAKDMPYKADEGFMRSYCEANKIPLHFRQITVDYKPEQRQPACFICSWKRRKELFSLASERNCSKLALGHHLDDAVETLLMNMIHHSSISSIPPKLSMFEGKLFAIRPLIFAHDKELKKYSEIMGFPEEVSLCLHEDKTSRDDVRELIHASEKLNRSARENIFRSMGTIYHDYIVTKPEKKRTPNV